MEIKLPGFKRPKQEAERRESTAGRREQFLFTLFCDVKLVFLNDTEK